MASNIHIPLFWQVKSKQNLKVQPRTTQRFRVEPFNNTKYRKPSLFAAVRFSAFRRSQSAGDEKATFKGLTNDYGSQLKLASRLSNGTSLTTRKKKATGSSTNRTLDDDGDKVNLM